MNKTIAFQNNNLPNLVNKLTYLLFIIFLIIYNTTTNATNITPTYTTKISAGLLHACLLNNKGHAFCWGDNQVGQLGIGNPVKFAYIPAPVRMPANTAFTQISVGIFHTCALDKKGKAYCWGQNGLNLGLGTNHYASGDEVNIPAAVHMPKDVYFTQITAGYHHTCALTTTGIAYCWGGSGTNYGQLGNGSTNNSSIPTPVHMPANTLFTQISAGYYHTCAVSTTDKVYCWGAAKPDSNLGQLGNDSIGFNHTHDSKTPSPVNQPKGALFDQVSAGKYHSCALTTKGVAYCWGGHGHRNHFGQNGANEPTTAPIRVNNPENVKTILNNERIEIVPNIGHTCTHGEGKIYCHFIQISTGHTHTCAINLDEQAFCWGSNQYGQLGNGTNTSSNRQSAVIMPDNVKFVQIDAGEAYTCALSTKNQVYCWGDNDNGQLGNGQRGKGLYSTKPIKIFDDQD